MYIISKGLKTIGRNIYLENNLPIGRLFLYLEAVWLDKSLKKGNQKYIKV